jgi:hypothetical protein
MANHDKEKERLARRDIVRFKVAMANDRVDIPALLKLQRACDRLHEVLEKQAKKRLIYEPLKKAEKNGNGDTSLHLSTRWFHGTDGGNVASIMEKGIQPRRERETNYPDIPSHPDMVYLSDAYGFYYAMVAQNHILLGCKDHDPTSCAVFEVDLKDVRKNIHADEDALWQQGNPVGVIDREMTPQEFNTEVIFRSLYVCGVAAHKGTIPPTGIKKVALIPNYHMVRGTAACSGKERGYCIREQQRAINQWIMDGGEFPVPPEEMMLCRTLTAHLAKNLVMAYPEVISAGVRCDTLLRTQWMQRPIAHDGIEVHELVVIDNEGDAAKMEALDGMLVAQKEVAMPAAA